MGLYFLGEYSLFRHMTDTFAPFCSNLPLHNHSRTNLNFQPFRLYCNKVMSIPLCCLLWECGSISWFLGWLLGFFTIFKVFLACLSNLVAFPFLSLFLSFFISAVFFSFCHLCWMQPITPVSSTVHCFFSSIKVFCCDHLYGTAIITRLETWLSHFLHFYFYLIVLLEMLYFLLVV